MDAPARRRPTGRSPEHRDLPGRATKPADLTNVGIADFVNSVVADVDEEEKHFWFQVPAWEHSALLRMRAEDIPETVRTMLQPDFRLFAQINLGAERSEDLYFDSWELPE